MLLKLIRTGEDHCFLRTKRKRLIGLKWWSLVVAGLSFLVLPACESHNWEGWLNTIDEGIDASNAGGKPMLVLFTAEWCPGCRQLESQVLSDVDVKNKLRRDFVLVRVDLTDQQGPNNQVAQEYGVQFIPSMMIFGTQGELIDSQGGMSVPQFLAWLEECRAKAG